MSEPKADEQDHVRARILDATAALIAEGGRDAATTRAICAAANVQAPTIYRLFGDKRGLLDAVAERGFSLYVADKAARAPHPDAMQALRDGWDLHVAFGLANPGLFAIMSGDPRPRPRSAAFSAGLEVLRQRIKRIALSGRLRVSEERALALIQAGGVGTVLTLLSQPVDARDLGLSMLAREAVMAAISTDAPAGFVAGPRPAAVALRASLDQTPVLSVGERRLLEELLDRISSR
jgi:AcrR family transcriptional regulator